MTYYTIPKELPKVVPNILEAVEDAIINQLSPLKEIGIAVTGWPSKHDDFGKAYPNGVCLIAYEKATWTKPEVTDIIEQEQVDTWTISVGLKNLRSHKGIYQVLKAIRMLLTGFCPPNCNQMYLLDEGFVQLDPKSRIWEYQVKFGCPSLHIQDIAPDVGALLKSIQFDSEIESFIPQEYFTANPADPIENITFTEE